MSEPRTEHPVAEQDVAGRRCELEWQCTERCHPPARCDQPATERVTTMCKDGCGRAYAVWLCCTRCADAIAARQTVPLARRPL